MVAGLGLVFLLAARPGVPEGFRIEGTKFVVLDERGRELWSHDTGRELEKTENYKFQYARTSPIALLPEVIIKDIDADGRKEVLFSIQTPSDEMDGGGDFFCFDDRGDLLWPRESVIRPVVFGDQTYVDFGVRGILAEDLNGDGRDEVIVLLIQRQQWPCRIVAFDCDGRVLGDYWHAGHFSVIEVADLNGDGRKEIIAGGQNSEYVRPAIAVLEYDRMTGQSPQIASEYRCPDLGPGNQLHYVLLPWTETNTYLNFATEHVVFLRVRPDLSIEAKTGYANLFYYFDRQLNLMNVQLSQGFELRQKEGIEAGVVKTIITRENSMSLAADIFRFVDGKWHPRAPESRGYMGGR